MVDRKRKSKKRSHSKKPTSLHRGFTLYLCHNLDYDDVTEALDRAGIRYKRHRDFFSGSTDDTVLLKKVGQKKWILITHDQRQRTRLLERKLIEQFRIREFVTTAGDIGDLGQLLVKANREMRNMCKNHDGPFVATISKSGKVYPKDDLGADKG